MSFRTLSLDPAPFRRFYGLSDAKRGCYAARIERA